MPKNYKPLPKSLTIKKSPIDGLGLFAESDISANTNLGLSHRFIKGGYIRTPIGAFYNHSENPNCIKEKDITSGDYYLVSIRDIKEGEEITVNYTLYEI